MGTQVYKADEETTGCCNTCRGTEREFTINMYDNTGQTFLKFYRPTRDCSGCCCCGHQCNPDKITCSSTDGKAIAYINQQDSKGLSWCMDSESFSFNYIHFSLLYVT